METERQMGGVALVLLWAAVSGCAGASDVGWVGSRLSVAPARSRGADRAMQRLRGGGCSCFGGSATACTVLALASLSRCGAAASQGDDWEGAVKEAPAQKAGQKPVTKQKTMLVRVRNSAVLVLHCVQFSARAGLAVGVAGVVVRLVWSV